MSIVPMTSVAAGAAVRPSRAADDSANQDRPPPETRDGGPNPDAGQDDQAGREPPPARLTIREETQGGLIVYTLADPSTGRLLMQIPRDEVEALALRPDYRAGQVIDTTV